MMADDRTRSFMSETKVCLDAEYLMNYYLSPTGRLESRKDDDETLEHFIKSCEFITEGYRETLLLQINHCLYQLHRKKLACPNLSSSQVLIMKSKETSGASGSFRTDIISLANIYCFVLTNGKRSEYSTDLSRRDLVCSDPDIALDLIKQMRNDDSFTIEDILKHPYHWSEEKKILFIRQVYEYINPGSENKKSRKVKEAVAKYRIDEGTDVIPQTGWLQELKLSVKERREIDNMQRKLLSTQPSQRYTPVKEDTIYEKGSKSDENSIFELVRFFRNRHVHYWEDSKNIRLAFGSYLSGYWKFYSQRYPKLFMHVYRRMMPYLRNDEMLLEDISLNKYLPTFTI